MIGFPTLKVTGRIDKHLLSILVDLGNIHNFINTTMAKRLHCNLINIKPLIVETANRETMSCIAMCRNFKWKIQGVNFIVDVFMVDLNNCDMVLRVQWLASLGDIIFNYKELWMSFYWQGQKVLLEDLEAINLQTVRLEQLNGWLTNSSQLAEINLCSLRIVTDDEGFAQLISTALIPEMKRDPTFKELLMKHQDVFKKPKRLPPIESS